MFTLPATYGSRQVCRGLRATHSTPCKVVRRQAVLVKAKAKDPTAFCVDKALVLGAAAFQAYLDPLPDQGTVDRSLEGTETRFFDSEYVRQHFAGVLQIKGVSATSLRAADLTGLSDAYLRASIGDSCALTETLCNTLDPEWETTLNVWVQKSEIEGELKLKVFDNDKFSSDDPLGRVAVPLSKFAPGKSTSLDLALTGSQAGKGSAIKLTATFLPFGVEGSGEGDKFLEEVKDADTKLAPGTPEEVRAINEALAAQTVGPDTDLNDAWDALCSTSDGVVFNKKETVAFVEAERSGTQVWISKDETTKTVLISFRGTEQTKVKDILVDINLSQADVELEDEPELSVFEKVWNRSKLAVMRRAGIAAHAGFYYGWTSVRQRVLRCVDNCTGRDPSWKLCVTGHSLGGALAILCAFELCNRKGPDHHITMYNYGGPRVGNQAFADSYTVPDSWRVHNHDDVVAKIPVAGLLGYRHIGTGVRITEDQKDYVFENILGEKISPEEVNEPSPVDLLESSLGSVTELLQKEADIIMSIANGEGIAAHMEPFYLGGLAGILQSKDGSSKVAADILDLIEASKAKAETGETKAPVKA